VTALAFSPGGSTLAAGYFDGTVYLWRLGPGTTAQGTAAPRTAAPGTAAQARTAITEPATVWGTAFSTRGLLAIGAANGSTYLVNPVTGAAEGRLDDPATGGEGVGAVAFTPDGASLVAGDSCGTSYLWRLA